MTKALKARRPLKADEEYAGLQELIHRAEAAKAEVSAVVAELVRLAKERQARLG